MEACKESIKLAVAAFKFVKQAPSEEGKGSDNEGSDVQEEYEVKEEDKDGAVVSEERPKQVQHLICPILFSCH